MKYEDLKYLSAPLPEDILKEKWSGNFDRARKIIDRRLASDKLPYSLRCRLLLELNSMDVLEQCYTLTKAEALSQVQEKIPEFTEEEFDDLQIEGMIDWIYLHGEARYLNSFCATLFKVYPELWERTICGDASNYQLLEDLVKNLEDGDTFSCHIHIRQKLNIHPDAFEKPCSLCVHLPVPQENDFVQNLHILEITPKPVKLPEGQELQPSIFFETTSANLEYTVEYEFDHVRKYIDLSKVDERDVANGEVPQDVQDYLNEELPHIQFTPYLKALAEEIRGNETNPIHIARKIYDYITTQTDYRFVREYASIDNLTEYCAVNSKGDCGVQALLFITLCRISGIPAKWESGLDAKPGDVGEHDWAMFYIPTLGWLYVDLSYGGSSYIRGAMKRWNFFFGNVDPYRIPINGAFQSPLSPEKTYWRIDPYDNQCGEVECENYGLKGTNITYQYEEIDIHGIG